MKGDRLVESEYPHPAQVIARVLVIDDEVGMREGCRRALAPLGHTVETAADLTQGKALILTGSYDLYLIDVALPDGSGLDLIDPILSQDPNAICIIITGFGSVEMAVEAVRRGAYDFLSKPFTSDELIVAVNQGLERRRLKAIEAQAAALAQETENLKKLDEVKSQLMLKVAHELRAPVAAVQSYLNLIQAGYISQEEMKSTLARMQQRLQETLDLVADLLDLARLKQAQDRWALQVSPQDMASILKAVCELMRGPALEKSLSLEMTIQDEPVLLADRDHMRQIWTNLISNAIKYTPENGRITVTLRADAHSLIGVVEDSGIGISEEELPNLFQEFFRSYQAKASGEIGTGLGLAIVKQIVDLYGGEVGVTPKPDQGSRFTFTLPLSGPPSSQNPAPGASDRGSPAPTEASTTPTRLERIPHTQAFVLGRDPAQGPDDG